MDGHAMPCSDARAAGTAPPRLTRERATPADVRVGPPMSAMLVLDRRPRQETEGRRPSATRTPTLNRCRTKRAPRGHDLCDHREVLVFDDDYMAAVAARADGRPAWERSAIHDLVLSDEKAQMRAWIEQEVARIPEPGRSELIRRLRSERSFLPSMHEVATAAVLTEAGLELRYEANVGGRTPDFLVPDDGSGHPAIVEVWTRELARDSRGQVRAWEALRARIGQIPVPAGLAVDVRTRKRAPSPRQSKEISSGLRRWLLDAPRATGESINVDGFRFVVTGTMPGLTAYLPVQHPGGWFDSSSVVDTIRAKVDRYRELTHTAGAALVVVVGSDVRAPLTLDLLRSTMRGQNSGAISWSAGSTGYIGEWSTAMRKREAAPTFDPVLSAVGWIEVGDADPQLHLFEVASARVPFARLTCPRIRYEQG